MFRTGYNYDTELVSDETALYCDPLGDRTQQQFAEECDINTIARRFGLTGMLPVSSAVPSYGDYTEVTDFQGAMNVIRQAEEQFLTVPALVRDRFQNDPQLLLEFVMDERNRPEAVELGLVPRPPAPPPVPEPS